jgi:multiple sugar transport system permease protein
VSFSAESKRDPSRPVAEDEKNATWDELKRWYAERAVERGDVVSRTMPFPLSSFRAEVRNALAVQFVDRGWRDFLSGAFANYRLVGDYLFLRGRAFANTVLLVVLTILASLTVNPLAAYALSRFRLPATEKVILFLLATMAFPAAVTAIPGFLLIRDLGLLNTFAALVLPSVASGMSIFILKGFFDALPRELYEAAAIDGAGEWTVFLRITLPMTTPILAVNALNSFIHAYSSWEWAFLVCQKESHWTLAVWMYQMSQTFSHQPWCVMAGFVLVSLPTAVVFLLCQKIILRGIVLPSMK